MRGGSLDVLSQQLKELRKIGLGWVYTSIFRPEIQNIFDHLSIGKELKDLKNFQLWENVVFVLKKTSFPPNIAFSLVQMVTVNTPLEGAIYEL